MSVVPSQAIVSPDRRPLRGSPSNRVGRLVSQGATAVLDQAIVSGTNFLSTILIARCCGTGELGWYALAFTLFVLASSLQESLIVAPYTVFGSRLSGAPRARCAGAALMLQMTLALLIAAGLAIFATGFAWWPQTTPWSGVLGLLAGLIPLLLFREFARRMAYAHLQVTTALVLDAATAVLQLSGLLWLAAHDALSAQRALAVMGAACALSGLCWFGVWRRQFLFDRASIQLELTRNWSLGKWGCLSRLASVAESYSVHWLLAILLGTSATGAFAACLSILALSNPLLMGAGALLQPHAARAYAAGGAAAVQTMVRRTTPLLAGLTAVFCLAVFALGPAALNWLYAMVHPGQAQTLWLLALSLLPSTVGMGADNGLRVLERPRANLVASLLGLAVSVVIAGVGLPRWGLPAAGGALAAGSCVTAIVRCLAFRACVREAAEVGP